MSLLRESTPQQGNLAEIVGNTDNFEVVTIYDH